MYLGPEEDLGSDDQVIAFPHLLVNAHLDSLTHNLLSLARGVRLAADKPSHHAWREGRSYLRVVKEVDTVVVGHLHQLKSLRCVHLKATVHWLTTAGR